jgi:hypothetical protein
MPVTNQGYYTPGHHVQWNNYQQTCALTEYQMYSLPIGAFAKCV